MKKVPPNKKSIASCVKLGKPPARKYGFICLARRVGSGGQTRLSAYGSKEQWKKKNGQKPVKAPLWHKHKRNGPCIISLNCCLGVRQSPFLRLCSSRHTFVQNPFGRWCVDRQKPILRNVVMFILVIFIIIIIKTR